MLAIDKRMGKIADEPVTMTTKVHVPTSEQLRIAQLLGDRAEDNAAMREKCQKVMETTGCSESRALITLHDCNNCIEEAVLKILDGSPEQGEWTVQEGRKPRKLQNYSIKDKDNNGTPSTDDFMNDDSEEITTSSKSRRGPGGGSGMGPSNRSGLDGPPRLRGRGGGGGPSRGQFPGRGRRGGGVGNENNDLFVNSDEHSSERGRHPRHNRGGRGEFPDRGRGRGGARGGVGRRPGTEQAFDGGMSTWSSAEPESNTWDNSMANNKWPSNRPPPSQQQQQQPQQAMGEWGQGVLNNNNTNKSGPASSNTWDNSMAQSVVNNSSVAQQPSTNHIDEWNPDDSEGEEDWQKVKFFKTDPTIKGRVFTSSTHMVQTKTLSSMQQQPANNSIFNSTVADVRTSDPTGIPPHMRGESIDVKSLFGQKTNSDVNDTSPAGSWSKQATDTLKNELGIGKVIAPSMDQTNQLVSRDVRQFGKPSMAKVEMPSSVVNMGKIDVEFGEFSSIKSRGSGDSAVMYEFGSTRGYNPTDLTTMPVQSTNDQSGKNVTVYQRTPSKDPQMNGSTGMLPVATPSSVKNLDNSSKSDMMPASYPNPANSYIGQDQYGSRSSSLLITNQPQKTQTGIPSGLQPVGQQKLSYMTNNIGGVQSTTMNETGVSQLVKDSNNSAQQQQQQQHQMQFFQAAMQTSQNIPSGLGYNSNRSPSMNQQQQQQQQQTSKQQQQINQTIINQATNPSYQALTASVPYMYDAAYLSALGLISPQGLPFNALPFDLSSLGQVAPMNSLRDVQSLGGADVKQQYNRNDGGQSTNNSISAPPGLGPATANNAEQAAQLMTPTGYQFMNPMQAQPYFAPFVVPTVTNSTASTISSGNQYGKNNVFSPPVYYNSQEYQPHFSADLQMQLDYSKGLYGLSTSQTKQATGSNVSLSSGDMNNKPYPGIKTAFDSKSFQNTATPPPGMGNVGYPTAFHQTAGTYGYPGFIPPHVGMNMMPPNIAQAAASLTTNDVMSGGGQRPGNPANKNATMYKQNPYWPT